MTTPARNRSPRPLVRRGPAVRGVTTLRLPHDRRTVWLPQPTSQYGGVLPYPPGTVLRIDIGPANHCMPERMEHLAGALTDCAEIEVVGTDPYGVAATRDALARALTAHCGAPAC